MEALMCALRYRQARKAKGITPEQAAVELGISFSTLASYERGSTQPTASTIKRMAEIYEVSADWLLGISEADDA